jgi:hypothetical protein
LQGSGPLNPHPRNGDSCETSLRLTPAGSHSQTATYGSVAKWLKVTPLQGGAVLDRFRGSNPLRASTQPNAGNTIPLERSVGSCSCQNCQMFMTLVTTNWTIFYCQSFTLLYSNCTTTRAAVFGASVQPILSADVILRDLSLEGSRAYCQDLLSPLHVRFTPDASLAQHDVQTGSDGSN